MSLNNNKRKETTTTTKKPALTTKTVENDEMTPNADGCW